MAQQLRHFVIYAGAALLMLPLVFTVPRISRRPCRAIRATARPSLPLARGDLRVSVAASCASLSTQAALFAVGGVMSVIGIARVHEVARSGRALIWSEVGSS